MNETELKNKTRQLLDENRFEEVAQYIFDAYQAEHPDAEQIATYRDKVVYKIRTAFAEDTPENRQHARLLLEAFMSIIGHSEGETAFNLTLLLLHFLQKNQDAPISEAIELIKLEKASSNLNMAS